MAAMAFGDDNDAENKREISMGGEIKASAEIAMTY